MAINLADYVKIDENGKPVFDNEAFNSALDRERNQASETARANAEKKLTAELTKKIKEDLENQANLTAEEKLKAEREAFQTERLNFNKERIKHIYSSSKLFTDEEIELFLGLSNEDYEKSSEKANAIVEARKKHNETYEKDFMAKLQTQQPRPDGNGGGSSKTESEAQKYAKKHSEKTEEIITF